MVQKIKRPLSFLLAVLMIIGMFAAVPFTASAAAGPVSYLVWDDAAQKLVEMTGDNACNTYTEVTADTATFEDGMWYVVNGEILNDNRITVTGTAHLILTDDGKLTTDKGINVANGSTLNIYGQGAGTGTVTAKSGTFDERGAGIGGKRNESGGTVNIYGGTVTATGSNGGAGIGGGGYGASGTGGTITIYGGTVTANGSGMGGAGIGGGTNQSAGIVTIYGGTVTANGNWSSPGIGPGANDSGGTLTVCGGSVTAVGTDRSDSITCTVKNTIPGTGWKNVNGTADETPIAINTEGQELTDFKKVQFLGVASTPNDQLSVSVDDQIHLNLFLDLGFRGKTVNDVTITLGGKTYACEGVKQTGGKYDGLYKFKVEMAPAQIADEIAVKIGDEEIPTSVKYYCDFLIEHNNTYGANDVALATAILNYGQAANNVFLGGADEIANLAGMNKTAVQSASATFTDGTGAVTGASFMALTKPEFRFYTNGITEQQGYDYNQAGVSATMANGGDTLTARFVKKADGKVLLEVKGISAENLDKTVTVTVTGLGSITFNGNAFAKAMANPNNNEAQQNLGAALYNYGVAAKTCFGT